MRIYIPLNFVGYFHISKCNLSQSYEYGFSNHIHMIGFSAEHLKNSYIFPISFQMLFKYVGKIHICNINSHKTFIHISNASISFPMQAMTNATVGWSSLFTSISLPYINGIPHTPSSLVPLSCPCSPTLSLITECSGCATLCQHALSMVK